MNTSKNNRLPKDYNCIVSRKGFLQYRSKDLEQNLVHLESESRDGCLQKLSLVAEIFISFRLFAGPSLKVERLFNL